MKKYTLTEEHRAQLKPWADKWIANAMSTRSMTPDDKMDCVKHVHAMYASAGLKAPRVVFVQSPFVAKFAAGFSAAVWWMRKNPEPVFNPDDATYAATRAATYDATYAATRAATYDATRDHSKWYHIPGFAGIIQYGASLAKNGFALQCANHAWPFYQGGNMWSGWSAYLTFFRYVAKLPLDYSKFDAFEKLTELSGCRFVHSEFCIISDRPEILKVDEQNLPHCDNGPFCRWRDGTELYSLHGVRLPAHYVLRSAREITAQEILKEGNVDIRRELIRKVGIERLIDSLPCKVLDSSGQYELLKIDFPGLVQDTRYLKMKNPSIDVWHLEGVERECNTVQEAINWRAGDLASERDWKPAQLT